MTNYINLSSRNLNHIWWAREITRDPVHLGMYLFSVISYLYLCCWSHAKALAPSQEEPQTWLHRTMSRWLQNFFQGLRLHSLPGQPVTVLGCHCTILCPLLFCSVSGHQAEGSCLLYTFPSDVHVVQETDVFYSIITAIHLPLTSVAELSLKGGATLSHCVYPVGMKQAVLEGQSKCDEGPTWLARGGHQKGKNIYVPQCFGLRDIPVLCWESAASSEMWLCSVRLKGVIAISSTVEIPVTKLQRNYLQCSHVLMASPLNCEAVYSLIITKIIATFFFLPFSKYKIILVEIQHHHHHPFI